MPARSVSMGRVICPGLTRDAPFNLQFFLYNCSMSLRPCLIQVCGMHFSGSSILNLLLNTQPGIRGCGELYHIYEGENGFCSCGVTLDQCSFYQAMDPEKVYETCLHKYGCRAIVDTSKASDRMEKRIPDGWDSIAVSLSKEPHAWLYSHLSHLPGEKRSMSELLCTYLWSYRCFMEAYDKAGRKMVSVTYKEVIQDTAVVIERICAQVTKQFDRSALERWWETDAHIAGGNAMVLVQVRSSEEYFVKKGKYQGKMHQLFLDEAWKQDKKFIGECIDAYSSIDMPHPDSVLQRLGHPDIQHMKQDLETLLLAGA